MRFGQKKTFKVKLGEPIDDVHRPSRRTTVKTLPRRATTPSRSRTIGSESPSHRSSSDFADQARLSDVARKGVRVTNVGGRGPAYGQLAPNDIILGELYPAKRDIRSVADLEPALSSIKGGDVIEFLVCAPSPQTRQCVTRAVSLQVGK